MNSSTVQFWGVEKILEAYENCQIPAWAFLQGKGIIHSYAGEDMDEGAQMLEKLLKMMGTRSTAVYALQLYKKPGDDITNKTEFNNRFQCKLSDEEYSDNYGGYSNKRIRELEEKLAEKEDEDDTEKIGGLQGILVGIIQKPEVQQFLLATVAGVVRKFLGGPAQPATMAGVPENETDLESREGEAYANLVPEEQTKLTRAMIILMQGDPTVGTNLLKIATLLQNDPGKYKMFAGML